jgi:hypothetical protein
MGYTLTQINTVLSKADRAIHILGSVAYNKKFAELDETYWYDRDIIFTYKSAVEWGKINDKVGTERMDWTVERLEAMMEIYDYGTLTPIYSQVAAVFGITTINFITEELDPTVPQYVKNITESNITNWNTAYGDKIVSGSVSVTPGVNEKTMTLVQQDGGVVNITWADTNYVHDQQTASATWVINHNLGKFASIHIVDTAGDEIVGEVKYNSINQMTVTFTSLVSGKAYIN